MSITIKDSSIDASASQLNININNSSSFASLVAKPDGTLQYANKNIVRSINGASADSAGNVNISISSNLPFSNGSCKYITSDSGYRQDFIYTVNCNCFAYLQVKYNSDFSAEGYRFTVKADNTVIYSGGNTSDTNKIMYAFFRNGQKLTVTSNDSTVIYITICPIGI